MPIPQNKTFKIDLLRKGLNVLFLFTIYFCLSQPVLADNLTIKIVGLSDPILQSINNDIATAQASLPKSPGGQTIIKFYRQIPELILQGMKAYGYFQSHVVRSQLIKQNSKWTAFFFVELGPPLRISSINVAITGPGKANPEFLKLLSNFPLKEGDVFESKRYEDAKDALYEASQRAGYLSAQLTEHSIEIDLKNYTATITLHLDTGPQYFFGRIMFSKTPLAESFLRRYLPFREGTPYSSEKIIQLQNALSSAPYFQSATVNTQQEQAKNHVIPIDINLVPRKAHQYSFGLGYGTDTGARVTLGWEWRFVTPTGHYLQTLLQLSQKQENNNIQARYIIPGKNPAANHYSINAGLFTNRPGNSQYFTQMIGLDHVNNQDGWQRTLSLDFQTEQFTINDGPSEKATNLIPGGSWEYVQANDRINTDNGYRVYYRAEGSLKPILSNNSFLQGEFQGEYIKSFNDFQSRVLLRTDIGYTTVSDSDIFPLSQRFFAGGSQSVRGYGFQDLGPGLILLQGSAEYQHKLHGKFYGAIFFDVGNAVDDFPLRLKRGVGVGLVYRTPIGPIEITVARALDIPGNSFKENYRIQFLMGPDL